MIELFFFSFSFSFRLAFVSLLSPKDRFDGFRAFQSPIEDGNKKKKSLCCLVEMDWTDYF